MEISAQNILLFSDDQRVFSSVEKACVGFADQVELQSDWISQSSVGQSNSCQSNSCQSNSCQSNGADNSGTASESPTFTSTWDLLIIHVVDDYSKALDACRQTRASKPFSQIIVISENSNSEVVSSFLDQGADDFIAIPWNDEEFLARIVVAVRRYQQVQQLLTTTIDDNANGVATTQSSGDSSIKPDVDPYKYAGDIRHCPDKREISVGDAVPRLTRTEYLLLTYLMERVSRPCSSVELLNNVLGYDNENYLPSLHSHVSRVRRKLNISQTTSIDTIWCYGYCLSVR